MDNKSPEGVLKAGDKGLYIYHDGKCASPPCFYKTKYATYIEYKPDLDRQYLDFKYMWE